MRYLKKELGGTWRPGPVAPHERIEPLRAVLGRSIGGRGLLQVDRERGQAVWQALRGGWHYKVARTGTISSLPFKDIHSHPGDAMSYGAAILFPLGTLTKSKGIITSEPMQAAYNHDLRGNPSSFQIGPGRANMKLPKHGETL